MNDNIKIGSHVRTRQDHYGIVSSIGGNSGLMTIGAGGLTPSGRNITVIFNGRVGTLSEDMLIVIDKLEATSDEIQRAETLAVQKQAEQLESARIDREAIQAGKDLFGAELATRKPKWAQSMIVAVLQHDDSDMQTDYFAASTSRTVVLAFSKHNRDLFSEMRKAAALYPETAHMGPGCGHFTVKAILTSDADGNGSYYRTGDLSHWHQTEEPAEVFTTRAAAQSWIDGEDSPYPIYFGEQKVEFAWEINEQEIEHRQKYSMGGGYFLLDGHTWSSGWKVHKIGICSLSNAEFLPTPETQDPITVEGVTVTENEDHNGVEIRFPGKPAEEVRNSLKAHKFRWSRRNTCWYHKRTEQALVFANSLAH